MDLYKKFYETWCCNYFGFSKGKKKHWGSKIVAGLPWNATRWPLDDAKMQPKDGQRIKSGDKGF